jgi:peptidoglycan hydrolase-like protein with peptidoglycan-binding domain
LLQSAILDNFVEKTQIHKVFYTQHKPQHRRHYQKNHSISQEAKWQLALQYLGYYQGKIDGDLLTSESYHAIETFQHKYQKFVSGLLDERFKLYLSDIYTQMKMKKDLLYKGKKKKKNSKKIQTALHIIGIYKGKIDGITGPKTKNAIHLYIQNKEKNSTKDSSFYTNVKVQLIQDAIVSVEQTLNEMKQESYFPVHYQVASIDDEMTIDP